MAEAVPVSKAGAVPARVLTVALAIVLLWFILRNAGLLLLADAAPDVALNLIPASPRALLAKSLGTGLSATTPPSPSAARELDEVIRNAPLAAEPLFAAAIESSARGRRAAATAQTEEALRRDPRLIAAYLFLAEQYLRAGRSEAALAKISIALGLPVAPEQRSGLMRAIYLLAETPAGRNALAREMERNPPWRAGFVRYVAEQGGDSDRLFDAMRSTSGDDDQRRTYLRGLVATKDYAKAYLAWVNFLPADAIDKVTPIYDGNFAKLVGPAPFNWDLVTSDSASSEMIDGSRISPGTALSVSFFGSTRTTIASELLLVPPGNYTLSITAVGSSDSSMGGSFSWEIACLPTAATVARLDFSGLRDTPVARRLAVTIPADCKAQTLTLFGVPGESTSQLTAEFGAMSLRRR